MPATFGLISGRANAFVGIYFNHTPLASATLVKLPAAKEPLRTLGNVVAPLFVAEPTSEIIFHVRTPCQKGSPLSGDVAPPIKLICRRELPPSVRLPSASTIWSKLLP